MNNMMRVVLKRTVFKKFGKNSEGGREALGMRNCRISI